MKHKKHDSIISGNYEKQKSKHLEQLATNLLKLDEKNQKLKEKQININFTDLFPEEDDKAEISK